MTDIRDILTFKKDLFSDTSERVIHLWQSQIADFNRIRGLIQWTIPIWQNYRHDKKYGLS